MERGGERRPGLQQGDAREAGDGCGEAGPTGRGVGRRGRRSNPNPEPRAIFYLKLSLAIKGSYSR
jgi:hypothetical protein